MSSEQQLSFHTKLRYNPGEIIGIFCKIDIKNATCYLESDLNNIFLAIDASDGGSSSINNNISEIMRFWFNQQADLLRYSNVRHYNTSNEKNSNNEEDIKNENLLMSADLYIQSSLDEKALENYNKVYDYYVQRYGMNSTLANSVLFKIAVQKFKLRQYDESINICEKLIYFYDSLIAEKEEEEDKYNIICSKLNARFHLVNSKQMTEKYDLKLILSEYEMLCNDVDDIINGVNIICNKDEIDNLKTMSDALTYNIAGIYFKQGRLLDATKLFRKIEIERRERLGEEHPEYLQICNTLAACLNKSKKFDEAIIIIKRNILSTQKTLGVKHYDTLLYMNNLAAVYIEMKEFDKSRSIFAELYGLIDDHDINTNIPLIRLHVFYFTYAKLLYDMDDDLLFALSLIKSDLKVFT